METDTHVCLTFSLACARFLSGVFLFGNTKAAWTKLMAQQQQQLVAAHEGPTVDDFRPNGTEPSSSSSKKKIGNGNGNNQKRARPSEGSEGGEPDNSNSSGAVGGGDNQAVAGAGHGPVASETAPSESPAAAAPPGEGEGGRRRGKGSTRAKRRKSAAATTAPTSGGDTGNAPSLPLPTVDAASAAAPTAPTASAAAAATAAGASGGGRLAATAVFPFSKNKDKDVATAELSALEAEQASLKALAARTKGLFEWVDGPLVTAMRNGEMLLLDELSLAEDAVLERLNSVLEPGRSITLAEKGGEGTAGGQGAAETVVAAPGFR